MKIERHSKAYAMACEKIPSIVAELAKEYVETDHQYMQFTMQRYSPTGRLVAQDDHLGTEVDLYELVEEAKRNPKRRIYVTDTKVTVSFTTSYGSQVIWFVKPLTE